MTAYSQRTIEVAGFDGERLSGEVFSRAGTFLRAPGSRHPLVLLPGHLRPARMLEPLAQALMDIEGGPDHILLVEYRGRGRSEPRSDASLYTPYAEARDVVSLTDALNWHHVDILGSARGGLVAMGLTALRPALIARLILNDIGPELDGVGVARLRTMASRASLPASWDAAATELRAQIGARYPTLTNDDYVTLSRLSYDEEDGRPAAAVHPSVIEHFSAIDADERYPTLWPEFRALRAKPVLLLRAEHSDVLNDEIVSRMHREHPGMGEEIVAGQGHAPFLARDGWPERIVGFLSPD